MKMFLIVGLVVAGLAGQVIAEEAMLRGLIALGTCALAQGGQKIYVVETAEGGKLVRFKLDTDPSVKAWTQPIFLKK